MRPTFTSKLSKIRCMRSAPSAVAARQPFSSSVRRQGGGGHGSHESPYDPPTGWLWGVPPGQKYENEGWEKLWFYGFWGIMAFGAVGYSFKSDSSIQTWALEEARRRLEAEGILKDEK
jgi:hypothetical protein